MGKINDIKYIMKFAYYPIKIDRKYIWFNNYYMKYKFIEYVERVQLPYRDISNLYGIGLKIISYKYIFDTKRKWKFVEKY